jgi:hypothetical protein
MSGFNNSDILLVCKAMRLPDDPLLRCRFVTRWGTGLTILLVVIWPALATPAKEFSKGYFTFWTIISIIWGILAALAMVIMPVRTPSRFTACNLPPHMALRTKGARLTRAYCIKLWGAHAHHMLPWCAEICRCP